MSDDSGEFAASALSLGLPHPPGYPLICLLGKISTLVPVGTVAFRLNLLSTCFVLLSLLLILGTLSKFTPKLSKIELFLGSFVFLGCRSLFAECLTAKGCIYTFTLFTFSIAAWVYFKSKDNEPKAAEWVLLLFVWGLGMANHWQSQLFWIPFIILTAWQWRRTLSFKTLTYGFCLAIVGMSVYLYLPLRGIFYPCPFWGDPTKVAGFYWVVTRQLVAGLEPLSRDFSFYQGSLKEYFRVMTLHWMPGTFILFLIGIGEFWRENRSKFWGWLTLYCPVFLAVMLVHEEKNTYLVPLYIISLSGLVMIAFVLGLHRVLAFLNGYKNKMVYGIFIIAILLASFFWLVQDQIKENRAQYTLAEDFGENVMLDIPRDGLVLAEGDHYVMSLWYLQVVRKLRPDILFEPADFLVHDWGWEQISRFDPRYTSLTLRPLFLDRFRGLTKGPRLFFYSLYRSKFSSTLDQLHRTFSNNGLTVTFADNPGLTIQQFQKQRFRNLEIMFDPEQLDPSSGVILHYYSYELYCLQTERIKKMVN
jgi:hypothetical protein